MAENEAEALNKKIMAPFFFYVSGRFPKIEKARKKAEKQLLFTILMDVDIASIQRFVSTCFYPSFR